MWNLFVASALAEGEAAAATAEATWLSTAFEKFGEISTTNWIALVALMLLGAGFLLVARQKSKWTPQMLAYGALSIALAFVLSNIRLWKMLQGGSITPGSMLPLMLFSYLFGAGPGILAGIVYGFLQFVQDSWMLNIWQFLLDYPIAFGMMGLVPFFKGRGQKSGLLAGIAVASIGRFISSTLSGAVFFASYAPEGVPPFIYSGGYNGTYMLPEMVICMVVAYLVAPRLIKGVKTR